MIAFLWRRFLLAVRTNHYRITLGYLCVMVTIVVILQLTASPVEPCK